MSDIQNYVKALLRHWLALASGVGSVIVAAISAFLRKSLPYWSFWTFALVWFFVASFRVWQDMHSELKGVRSELNRLRVPKYSNERLRLAREQYGKLRREYTALLRELRVRGQMMEDQAEKFNEFLGFGKMYGGLLNALQNTTSFVHHDIGDQYRINPDMEAALDKIFEESDK